MQSFDVNVIHTAEYDSYSVISGKNPDVVGSLQARLDHGAC